MQIQPTHNQEDVRQFLDKLDHKGPISPLMVTKFLNEMVKTLGVTIQIAREDNKRAQAYLKKSLEVSN